MYNDNEGDKPFYNYDSLKSYRRCFTTTLVHPPVLVGLYFRYDVYTGLSIPLIELLSKGQASVAGLQLD